MKFISDYQGVTIDAEVMVVKRDRRERDTATTAISDSSRSSGTSSSDENDGKEIHSDNNAINDHYHHVVHVVNAELTQGRDSSGWRETATPGGSTSFSKTAAAVAQSSNTTSFTTAANRSVEAGTSESLKQSEISENVQQTVVVVDPKNNCESCTTRVVGQNDPNYSQCDRSKSLPHPGKKGTAGGTVLGDSNEITTIRELTTEQSNSVSGVLRFCKRRVLFPYLKLLGAMGLKPLYADGNNRCVLTLSKVYLVLVGLVLIIGYGLQFVTCFRRDRGFSYKQNIQTPPTSLHKNLDDFGNANGTTHRAELWRSSRKGSYGFDDDEVDHKWFLEDTICTGNVIYVYIVPCILHMASFMYMVYLYWIYDDEHLQNLMERVFIQAAHANINFFSQRRLIRRLQGLVGVGTVWIIMITFCQVLQVYLNKIYFNFWIELDYNTTYALSAVLLFATLWQDAIQVTIVMSFAIQCNLICTYTELIKGRLMQHSISLPECMRELGELSQLLSYLNDDLALGLAPLLLIDGMYATGAIVHLIQNGKHLDLALLSLSVLTAILWVFIIVFPLIHAASVSTYCQKLKDMGHMVRIRPFGYQFVSQFDLDSFLLFASNLNLKARILKIPITSPILSFVAVALATELLLWGYFQ